MTGVYLFKTAVLEWYLTFSIWGGGIATEKTQKGLLRKMGFLFKVSFFSNYIPLGLKCEREPPWHQNPLPVVLEKLGGLPRLAKWGIVFWGNVKILLLSQFQQFTFFQIWIQFSLPESSSMQPPYLPNTCFGSSVTSLTKVSGAIMFLCYSSVSTEINEWSFCLLANSCNIIIKFSAVPYLNQ